MIIAIGKTLWCMICTNPINLQSRRQIQFNSKADEERLSDIKMSISNERQGYRRDKGTAVFEVAFGKFVIATSLCSSSFFCGKKFGRCEEDDGICQLFKFLPLY